MPHDPEGTQRDLRFDIAAELAAAGFDSAREIGRGGFGVVFECVEPSLDRHVAVKVLTSEVSDEERARFLREQQALGRLSGHPHIVQVMYADITATGRPYIVMALHRRGSLMSRVRDLGPVPWPEVLSIGVKVAGALAAAHACGILHRDVNPANILVSDYGEPQLADFGIARIGGVFETAAGVVAGTPAFTAPEILRGGEPSASSDIYGLGASLFCLLTGHAAFERQAGESLVTQFLRISSEPIPDLRAAGVPGSLCAAIESAVADPADRPDTVQEFGERLRNVQFASGLPVDAMALPRGSRASDSVQPEALPVPVVATRVPEEPLPTPETRYRPPTSLRRLVERPRLLNFLREAQTRRLVLIHGPAGFGKTTVAAQWGDALEAEGVRVAWLSVDPDDNNVVWFLAHIVHAIRRGSPGLATGLTELLEQQSSEAGRHVMTALIDQIHDSGETIALVVDDWHRVTSRSSIAAMEFLLDRGCHHLRLIVASRTRTGLPLSRLRVRDELLEIDEAALRFDATETTEFLTGMNGLALAATDMENLRRSTEGWVAALQLASLSLRGKPDPGTYISQISGRHYAIGEYLLENVVDSLEPDMLEFLMRTSVTERICGELAEVLTERTPGQELLEEVRRRDLFLRNVDDDLRWFRYHGLFADFLRRRLVLRHPGLLEQLHRRASLWFAEHDMPIEAVDHALAADDPDLAMCLVQERAEQLLEASRMATLLGLSAKLPGSLTALNPVLQVQIAWANIALLRPAAASAALDRADAAVAAGTVDDEQAEEIGLAATVARSCNDLAADRYSEIPAPLLARVRKSASPFLCTTTAIAASASALYRFDFEEVHRWHRWIAPYRDRTSGPFSVMYCDCIAGMAAAEQLDIATAESCCRTAMSLALQTGKQSHATRLASALLGELLYERGQFIEAEELLSIGLGPEGGAAEFLLATYGTGARVAAVRGDLDRAQQRLAAGAEIAADLSQPRLAARMVNERVRLGLPIPDTERQRLESLPPYTAQPDLPLAVALELAHDSAIRLLLAEQTPAASQRACDMAEHLVREISRQERPRALLLAELMHGCCLSATGQNMRAAELLAPALTRCAKLGLVRLVVDSGRHLQPVLETLAGAPSTVQLPRSFLMQTLAQYESVPPKRGGTSEHETHR
ncbi:serine/threonine-protein kinase [Nocardia rhizosphaerihabitans]|uniref:Serine/threonine-protein kinase PknK n=1 Tax=Nocardia rhizosphaerihabitans TaxID=1691570 RepID=A0ABQ2L2V5_9NOCA|nr:serine/threonine-protein kinase [Nocardia rhizosphaerihabitans]GGO00727.1 serine/threonine-protein kinase PknK [Nocardia rhizosphaerihabitans]